MRSKSTERHDQVTEVRHSWVIITGRGGASAIVSGAGTGGTVLRTCLAGADARDDGRLGGTGELQPDTGAR